MPDNLRMPHDCKKARKISDDLKWGKKLSGTHDDHVGLQGVAAYHNARKDHERTPDGMTVYNVKEGQTPAILKKR